MAEPALGPGNAVTFQVPYWNDLSDCQAAAAISPIEGPVSLLTRSLAHDGSLHLSTERIVSSKQTVGRLAEPVVNERVERAVQPLLPVWTQVSPPRRRCKRLRAKDHCRRRPRPPVPV